MRQSEVEPVVLILATLDTKGPEATHLREVVRRAGARPLVLDLSVFGVPTTGADIRRDEVARTAGATVEMLRTLARADALDVMARGATAMPTAFSGRTSFTGWWHWGAPRAPWPAPAS